MALTEREETILSALLDAIDARIEEEASRRQPISLAVDVDTESLSTVVRRQNDLIEKMINSNAELKRGMAVLAEMLIELRTQITRPREPVSLTIQHADGKTSKVTG